MPILELRCSDRLGRLGEAVPLKNASFKAVSSSKGSFGSRHGQEGQPLGKIEKAIANSQSACESTKVPSYNRYMI